MTAAVNRYKFTKATVTQAVKFLKGTGKRQPNFLKKFKGTLKDGKLHLDGKRVIPKEDVESFLRERIYKGGTPLSRDSAFYAVHRDTVGVSRAQIDLFLKSQRIIRETDDQQPAVRKKGRKVQKKGQLHLDLVEIKFQDLPFTPSDKDIDESVDKGYILGMVDALTSLSYFKWHVHKTQSQVTPIVKQAVSWFERQLKTDKGKFTIYSDKGREFSFPTYEKWGIKTIQLARSPIIEAKNAFFQRTLFRLAKMENTQNLKKLISQATDIMNNTVSKVSKRTPLENLAESAGSVAEKYNAARAKAGKSRLRDIVPGKDKVRINLVGPKKGLDHKAYKGKTWSKKIYQVAKKRGERYLVGKKYYHRQDLKITSDYDSKSEGMLQIRKTARHMREDKKRAAIRKKLDVPKAKTKPKKTSKKIKLDVDTSNIVESRRGRRSVRAQKGKEKYRRMMDKDRAIGRAL